MKVAVKLVVAGLAGYGAVALWRTSRVGGRIPARSPIRVPDGSDPLHRRLREHSEAVRWREVTNRQADVSRGAWPVSTGEGPPPTHGDGHRANGGPR